MTDNRPGEKREYIRTDSSLQARIKPISVGEFEKIRFLRTSVNLHDDGGSSVSMPDNVSPPVSFVTHLTEFLIQIDSKLDRLINMLGGERVDETQVEVEETVNISGSGICLKITEPLEVGQLLEISLNIPVFPSGVLKTYGEVVRVTSCEDAEKKLFDTGIRFIDIREEERDWLIAYSFSQQRKIIRESKKKK
jgi:c-di-GMP-binding flagellar brake protein YcgR